MGFYHCSQISCNIPPVPTVTTRLSNKDVSKKFNAPKNILSTWKKNWENIIAAFKSSGGTKRQQIKEGTYEQVNLACYKWLQMQRSENIPIK